jgi:xylulokinase
MAGGGARSEHWNQIRADVFGRPVVVSHIPEMGLSGCLALARVGLGLAADIASAVDASQEFTHYLPDPEHTARYDTLYRIFRDTHDTMADASHRLAHLGRGQLQSDPA